MKTKLYYFLAKKLRPVELAYGIKKVLMIKRRDVRIADHMFYLDPVSDLATRLMASGTYEPEIRDLIKATLQEGDTFVDLGANEGYFSILASQMVGPTGKVVAIEPQERLWGVILRNIQLNHCTNVQLVPYAIGERKEEVEFILTPSINTGSSSIVKSSRNRLWKRQMSRTTTLDNLLGKGKVKLIKIDIEGYEYFALKGASKVLKAGQIENIILELHPAQLKQLHQSVEGVNEYLSDCGFTYRGGIYTRA
jgi:FkbM family methyltransferase